MKSFQLHVHFNFNRTWELVLAARHYSRGKKTKGPTLGYFDHLSYFDPSVNEYVASTSPPSPILSHRAPQQSKKKLIKELHLCDIISAKPNRTTIVIVVLLVCYLGVEAFTGIT